MSDDWLGRCGMCGEHMGTAHVCNGTWVAPAGYFGPAQTFSPPCAKCADLERDLAAAEYHRDGVRATVEQLERELAAARAELERLNSPVLKSDWQQMEADLAAARADCAQFCGDNECLIKAAGAETVAGALEAIAITRAQLKAANAYARSDVQKVDAARAEAARLREAFARYARHDDDCGPWAGGCRCGYAAAKAALERHP